MVIGDYPCCGGPLFISVPDNSPKFEREECPHCGAVVYHKLSRIDPESWIEAEFLKEFDVDDEHKTIRERADRGRGCSE
jgi:hypothetical protein